MKHQQAVLTFVPSGVWNPLMLLTASPWPARPQRSRDIALGLDVAVAGGVADKFIPGADAHQAAIRPLQQVTCCISIRYSGHAGKTTSKGLTAWYWCGSPGLTGSPAPSQAENPPSSVRTSLTPASWYRFSRPRRCGPAGTGPIRRTPPRASASRRMAWPRPTLRKEAGPTLSVLQVAANRPGPGGTREERSRP